MLVHTLYSATVILGLGNSLRGDDGVGPAVIEWLDQQELPADVEAIDGGTAGLDIVSTLMGHEQPSSWTRRTSNTRRAGGCASRPM